MKWRAICSVMLLSSASLLFAVTTDRVAEKFTVSQRTLIPGLTLQPGTYSISVVSETGGRYILRIEGDGGTPHSIFAGVPLKQMPAPGVLGWDKGPDGIAALRGFAFRNGGMAVEFVYPKNDAVSLATLNRAPVLAVDPASEGRSPELSSLTNDEIQAVTLWTLTPEPVAPYSQEAPKISASRYEVGDHLLPSKPEQMARSKVTLKVLPHTAGFGLLALVIGVFALGGGLLLTRLRLTSTRR